MNRLLQTLILLLLAILAGVITDSFHETTVAAGDSAPDFSITADNGRTITPLNFGGKLLVLNFWATWCLPCVEEIPSLSGFQRRFARAGVVVVGISDDNDEASYRAFLARTPVSFRTAHDPEGKVKKKYGTLRIPETYIIDRRGKVLRKIVGSQNWMTDQVIRDVETLLTRGS